MYTSSDERSGCCVLVYSSRCGLISPATVYISRSTVRLRAAEVYSIIMLACPRDIHVPLLDCKLGYLQSMYYARQISYCTIALNSIFSTKLQTIRRRSLTLSHPRQPPFAAEGEKQDLFEADPNQRPVLERLRVERHRAADSRPTGCAAGGAGGTESEGQSEDRRTASKTSLSSGGVSHKLPLSAAKQASKQARKPNIQQEYVITRGTPRQNKTRVGAPRSSPLTP